MSEQNTTDKKFEPRTFDLVEGRRYVRRDSTVTPPLEVSTSIQANNYRVLYRVFSGGDDPVSWLRDPETGYDFDPADRIAGHGVYYHGDEDDCDLVAPFDPWRHDG